MREDNARRLSNPASMTPPRAVLLITRRSLESETSAALFTMETPHHWPPTVAHYRADALSAGPGSVHLSLTTLKNLIKSVSGSELKQDGGWM